MSPEAAIAPLQVHSDYNKGALLAHQSRLVLDLSIGIRAQQTRSASYAPHVGDRRATGHAGACKNILERVCALLASRF